MPAASTASKGVSGAWVLSGADAAQAVPAAVRAALRIGSTETLYGPLWLSAPADAVARDGSRLAALVGHLAGGAASCSPAALLSGWTAELPDAAGHYAALRVDLERGTLTLIRDVFGMARLYLARSGDLLLFSTHAKALLSAGAGGGIDREAALEAVLGSDLGVIFGDRTLLSGIRELPPGEGLVLSRGGENRIFRENRFAESWRPGPLPSAHELRRELAAATDAAVGPQTRVAVALSGGIDSSVIAALTVERLGAPAVEAFTYEFADPSHPSEVPYAAAVCRHLKIAHHVVRVDFDQYASSLPELFWRLEAPRLSPGAWLPFTRALAERGFSRVLTGDGMELALGFSPDFEETSAIARVLRRLPRPDLLLRHWRPLRFTGAPGRARLEALAPGLAPPPGTAYHMVLCVLHHNGLIPDVGKFYPEALRELARDAARSKRVREAVTRHAALPLEEQLRIHRLNAYTLHRHFRGKPDTWSELGGARPACPALLMAGAPLPRRELWRNNRALLHAAVGSMTPEEVWRRPKIPNQSILPRAWTAKIHAGLASLAPETLERLSAPPGAQDALLRHYGRELALLGLWARLFDAGPVSSEPPTSESLGLDFRF